jgi:hypothetical protein
LQHLSDLLHILQKRNREGTALCYYRSSWTAHFFSTRKETRTESTRNVVIIQPPTPQGTGQTLQNGVDDNHLLGFDAPASILLLVPSIIHFFFVSCRLYRYNQHGGDNPHGGDRHAHPLELFFFSKQQWRSIHVPTNRHGDLVTLVCQFHGRL